MLWVEISLYLNTKLYHLPIKYINGHKTIFIGYTTQNAFDNGQIS